jgi:hypothetical protein
MEYELTESQWLRPAKYKVWLVAEAQEPTSILLNIAS